MEQPRTIPIAMSPPVDLLSRYLRGDHCRVWQELHSHEAVGGDLLEEARAVAAETMKRVAAAADLLAERLAARGWKPLGGLSEHMRTRPSPKDDLTIIKQIEARTRSPLPLSLLAFWQYVGGINFVWDYDCEEPAPSCGLDLFLDEQDPLYVGSPKDTLYLLNELEEHRSPVDLELRDPFELQLAPDYLHKANISGGVPYSVQLPFSGIDPIFANERHKLPFVDYLRLCFRWGGFPLLEITTAATT